MKLVLTNHAIKRAHERYGWNERELHSQAKLSLEEGLYVLGDEVLREIFIKSVIYNSSFNKNWGSCMLYANKGIIFVFDEDRLVTVFPLNGRF